MNVLLLDVGNSRLKWGLLSDATIRGTGHVELRTFREQGTSALTKQWSKDIDAVIACNVAGDDVAEILSAGVRSQYGHEVRFIRSEGVACGVTNGYHQPERLGVDRWVALIGARASCDSACVIVDAGTAITIDALNADGHHLGGQILPGLVLMAEALEENTSDLPSLSDRLSDAIGNADLFANSTSAAISRGVVGAAVGAIELALRGLRKDGLDPALLITGGDADLINGLLGEAAQLRPDLVLEGLACLAERER